MQKVVKRHHAHLVNSEWLDAHFVLARVHSSSDAASQWSQPFKIRTPDSIIVRAQCKQEAVEFL